LGEAGKELEDGMLGISLILDECGKQAREIFE